MLKVCANVCFHYSSINKPESSATDQDVHVLACNLSANLQDSGGYLQREQFADRIVFSTYTTGALDSFSPISQQFWTQTFSKHTIKINNEYNMQALPPPVLLSM